MSSNIYNKLNNHCNDDLDSMENLERFNYKLDDDGNIVGYYRKDNNDKTFHDCSTNTKYVIPTNSRRKVESLYNLETLRNRPLIEANYVDINRAGYESDYVNRKPVYASIKRSEGTSYRVPTFLPPEYAIADNNSGSSNKNSSPLYATLSSSSSHIRGGKKRKRKTIKRKRKTIKKKKINIKKTRKTKKRQ